MMKKFSLKWARSSDVYKIEHDQNGCAHWGEILHLKKSKEELIEQDLACFMANFEKAIKIKGKYDLEHFARIHNCIFGEIYPWAGMCRNYGVQKREKCLSGASVDYCSPEFIQNSFNLYVEPLLADNLKKKDVVEQTKIISSSLQGIWQTHCFPEGNTRSTIIFVKKILKDRGINFDVEYLKSEKDIYRRALSFYSTGQDNLMKPLETIIYNALSKEKFREPVVIPERIEKNLKTGRFNVSFNKFEAEHER